MILLYEAKLYIVYWLFWCCGEVKKTHSTYFVLDVVVHCRNSIILICPRVEKTKALHAHGVNCVRDRLIKILRQIKRGIQLLAGRLNSCSWAAEKSSNQEEAIHDTLSSGASKWQAVKVRVTSLTESKSRDFKCRVTSAIQSIVGTLYHLSWMTAFRQLV